MNVNFGSSLPVSLAGNAIAQTKGTETDRVTREVSEKAREQKGVQRAEAASDVGETDDADVETTDRDADGRQLWERRSKQPDAAELAPETNAATESNGTPHVKDLTGDVGKALDLEG